MDTNWFFRWVWRFNGLALAILLCAAIAVFVNLWIQRAPIFGRLEPAAEAPLPPPTKSDLAFQLIDATPGSDHVLFAYGEDGYIKDTTSFAPARPGRTLNYLFYDTRDGSTRWLFPDHNQVVVVSRYVWDDSTIAVVNQSFYETNPGAPSRRATGRTVRAILFDVTPLSGATANNWKVYASRADGTHLTKLIDNAALFWSPVPNGPESIVIPNRRVNRTYATTISLTDFKQTREVELSSKVPK